MTFYWHQYVHHQTWQETSISSPAFAASRQQIPPYHPRLPVLPQSGDVSAMFGLVVPLHKQLREREELTFCTTVYLQIPFNSYECNICLRTARHGDETMVKSSPAKTISLRRNCFEINQALDRPWIIKDISGIPPLKIHTFSRFFFVSTETTVSCFTYPAFEVLCGFILRISYVVFTVSWKGQRLYT